MSRFLYLFCVDIIMSNHIYYIFKRNIYYYNLINEEAIVRITTIDIYLRKKIEREEKKIEKYGYIVIMHLFISAVTFSKYPVSILTTSFLIKIGFNETISHIFIRKTD